jgi:hypothetical protein
VDSPATVILRNLTIQGGGPTLSNETPPIGDPCFNSGGGVRNWSGGALTLENVTIQNNAMPAKRRWRLPPVAQAH